MKETIKNHSRLFSLMSGLLAMTLIFLGGLFSSSTELEEISEYATNVVLNHTENKKLCAITVEKNGDSGSIPDAITEFHSLYGTFKQEKITFASAVNTDKRHDIRIANNISDNLSLLYSGPTGSISYKGHYKHYTFPIETMFSDVDTYSVSEYVAYISESHARLLLENANVKKQSDGKYLKSDYESLLKQPLSIIIDGQESVFGICNIYYQNNYYYDGLNDVMGDFIMVSYYLPYGLRSEQQNIYFMSDYTYQNKYFMNYINNVYSSKKFLLKVNHYNIVGDINDEYLTSFYYSTSINNLDWLNILFVTFAVALLLISIGLLYLSVKEKVVFNCLINCISLFIPYILFAFIYKITGNVSFLSEVSCRTNVFSILIYVILVILLIGFRLRTKPNGFLMKGVTYYEVNI